MNYMYQIAKGVFSLILLMPVLGVVGVFPPPTAEFFNTPEAFEFIMALEDVMYINVMMAVVCAGGIALLLAGRTALAALLVLPITVNVVAFHGVIDGGLFTAGAALGNLMLVLNLYFLWKNRATYKALLLVRESAA